MAANDEYATLTGPIPDGFAVYQMPGVQLGDHIFFGWKMVKQKSESYTDDDGKAQERSVDDESVPTVYDGTTQLLQDNAEKAKEIASLKAANDLTQHGLMEAVDYLSSQLPVTGTTTTTATDTSSAAPASSAAGEVK
ncbi:hypothetical protein APL41_gp02 [Lactobacillus phage LBR48]|uniref:Uncharacterized protein n=1 Tax=Lactobacillus phage LBR48 TaxID=755164 RepID=D6PSR6_9CAUD|nr:hypothetical protein APL41_gp02 [Lactobacillus phage LBR48]ADF83407.1 hypothetical protein [Lactobacillus phage LBR48]